MKTFSVTYPSGAVEEVSTIDCDTVEAFINMKFGSVDPAEHGVVITEVGVAEETAPEVVLPEEEAANEPL